LPARLIEDLDLELLGRVRAALGDGSEVAMAGFEATVLWDGERRDVFVLEADGVPLVGMAMLLDHRLTMDVEPDGVVQIGPLDPSRTVPVA
jgi:predicted aspartyl protease